MKVEFNLVKAGAMVLPLVFLFAVSACDSTSPSPSAEGNSRPSEGQAGSQPSSSLTFSPRSSTNSGAANKDTGVLNTTLTQADSGSFNDLQVLVFGPMCSGCHIGGGSEQPALLDFTSDDNSYASLVNFSSINEPALSLVQPGNPSGSYLLKVLEGTQATGSRMPLRARPVSDELIAKIRAWIEAGAKR